MSRLIVLIAVLVAYPVNAIDEDYDIPYTDTYGYVYDPETGQFVQQKQAGETASTTVTADAGNAVEIETEDQDKQIMVDIGTVPEPGKYPEALLFGLGAGILALLILFYYLRRGKSGTLR